MKRRVVDEINVDFRRLVVLAIWRAQQIIRKNLQEKVAIRRTSDLLVHPTKPCVGHDRAQNKFEWWMHEVEGCFYGRDPRSAPRGQPHHILSSSCPPQCGRNLRPISSISKTRSCPNLKSSTMPPISCAMSGSVPRAATAYPPSFPLLTPQPPPRQSSKRPGSTSQSSMAHSPQQQ